jgi:ankyrin repeat protein
MRRMAKAILVVLVVVAAFSLSTRMADAAVWRCEYCGEEVEINTSLSEPGGGQCLVQREAFQDSYPGTSLWRHTWELIRLTQEEKNQIEETRKQKEEERRIEAENAIKRAGEEKRKSEERAREEQEKKARKEKELTLTRELWSIARTCQDPDIIRNLIQDGASPDTPGADGFTAFCLAANHNRNPGVIEAYLKASADPYVFAGKSAAIFSASHNRNPEILKIFMDFIDPNYAYGNGRSLLFVALFNLNESLIYALINAGVDVNYVCMDYSKEFDNSSPYTPLHYLVVKLPGMMLRDGSHREEILQKGERIAKALLNAGADASINRIMVDSLGNRATILDDAENSVFSSDFIDMLVSAGAKGTPSRSFPNSLSEINID